MIKRYQLLPDGCILDTKYDTTYTVIKKEEAGDYLIVNVVGLRYPMVFLHEEIELDLSAQT